MRVTVVVPSLAIGAGPKPGTMMSSAQAQPITNGPFWNQILIRLVFTCINIKKPIHNKVRSKSYWNDNVLGNISSILKAAESVNSYELSIENIRIS